jgi:hypothetical protein
VLTKPALSGYVTDPISRLGLGGILKGRDPRDPITKGRIRKT